MHHGGVFYFKNKNPVLLMLASPQKHEQLFWYWWWWTINMYKDMLLFSDTTLTILSNMSTEISDIATVCITLY